MVRKKKETLVHLDLDTLSKEVPDKKAPKDEAVEKTALGQILKKAREKRKLSIDEIARKLHIRASFLEALETGHYYVFPGLAYGVGFLRTYAEFLGLDSKELILKFHAETSEIKSEPMEMPIPQNHNLMPSFRTILMSIIVLLIAYLVWYITMTLTSTVPQQDPVLVVTEETQDPASESFSKTAVPLMAPVPVVPEAPIIADSVAPSATNVVMKEGVKGGKVSTAPKIYGVPQSERLSLLANEEVWIEVREGDRVVLEEVLYPGDRYNAPADSSGLVLTTANAGALTVLVNGRAGKPLGGKGTLVEGISLDINKFN